MTLLGKDVRIDSAEQQAEYNDRNYFRQSGLNVAVGGATVDTIQSARAVYGFAKRAGEVEDDRLKALYAYKAAQGANAVAQAAGAAVGRWRWRRWTERSGDRWNPAIPVGNDNEADDLSWQHIAQ